MRNVITMLTLMGVAFVANAQPLLSRLKPSVTLVAAHRGGFNDSLPENSMVNFRHTVAKSRQLVMLEFDVRKSKSGTLYILHDATVDRTTNGTGEISTLQDDYITSLHLKDLQGRQTTEKVPTVSEFLSWAKSAQVLLMMDVKADVWAETLAMIHSFDMTDRCLVLTFKTTDTQRVRTLSPSIAISCLVSSTKEWSSVKSQLPSLGPVMAYVNDSATPALLAQVSAAGIRTLADVSEHSRHNGKLLSRQEYKEALSRLAGGILVTDYPIEVSIIADHP
ncbi:MAG: glycerophosphodiester phosphodiesterase family protein [Cyclobacteriaceae bacterium]|nr:glycerophosphodiester phosphodiesterase family protein [Cyclobacteriaceae bacterium]HQQ81844.1 glycerophosphodiester phosphodiesterase family protein [Cyclobacteriaceae bacterium]